VHDLDCGLVETHGFELAEAFACDHDQDNRIYDLAFLRGSGYTCEALMMDHGPPSVAYLMRELPRVNIDADKLAPFGLRPGPWLQKVRRSRVSHEDTVFVEGRWKVA
jgi:ribonuclease Z